jgi:hypothetical protein
MINEKSYKKNSLNQLSEQGFEGFVRRSIEKCLTENLQEQHFLNYPNITFKTIITDIVINPSETIAAWLMSPPAFSYGKYGLWCLDHKGDYRLLISSEYREKPLSLENGILLYESFITPLDKIVCEKWI